MITWHWSSVLALPGCIPILTSIVILYHATIVDGGTAWMTRESVNLESDAVDSSVSGIEPWFYLAQQLKKDLASIILMSEAELQVG